MTLLTIFDFLFTSFNIKLPATDKTEIANRFCSLYDFCNTRDRIDHWISGNVFMLAIFSKKTDRMINIVIIDFVTLLYHSFSCSIQYSIVIYLSYFCNKQKACRDLRERVSFRNDQNARRPLRNGAGGEPTKATNERHGRSNRRAAVFNFVAPTGIRHRCRTAMRRPRRGRAACRRGQRRARPRRSPSSPAAARRPLPKASSARTPFLRYM